MLYNNQQETAKLYSTTTPVAMSRTSDSSKNACSGVISASVGVRSPETQRKNTQMLDTSWIVGFLEGDGCMTSTITSYGPDLSFIVRQADPEIL